MSMAMFAQIKALELRISQLEARVATLDGGNQEVSKQAQRETEVLGALMGMPKQPLGLKKTA